MTEAIIIEFVVFDQVLINYLCIFSHLSCGNLMKWRWHFNHSIMNREEESGVGVGQCVACWRSVPHGSGHGSPVSYLYPAPQSPLLNMDLWEVCGPWTAHVALGGTQADLACTMLHGLPLVVMMVKMKLEAGAFAPGAQVAFLTNVILRAWGSQWCLESCLATVS